MKLVAIVGRPNVGKSTLFNRLVGKREAIIEDTPGVTRDRIYGKSEWNGKKFEVIDTGGFIPGSEDNMEKAIREQAMIAIEEADYIIFVVDAKDGITRFDTDIANILRRAKKRVTLVVNKCDNHKIDSMAYEFYELGIGEPFSISAINGRSTGDFLDHLVDNMDFSQEDDDDERLKIAFVGRPNAGKSSLTNALLGYDRNIVDAVPGTTRDAIDSVLKYNSHEIVLIDTAGLRKRTSIKDNIERWSAVRSQRAIERCDIGVVIIDVNRGIEDQDKKIINYLHEARKGIIIVFNKWDAIDKDSKTLDEITRKVREEMKTFSYVPILFISATERTRIFKVIDTSIEIDQNRKTRIKTNVLNKTILPELEKTPPPSVRGYDLRINYIVQTGTEPPVIALFLNHPTLLPDSYKRFIEKRVRESFGFEGTPISLVFRKKNVAWEERERD